MRVAVYNHYTGVEKVYTGTPAEVEQELYRQFPWFRTDDIRDQGDLESLVEAIDSQQAFDANIEQDPMKKTEDTSGNLQDQVNSPLVRAMLGHNVQLQSAFAAARFLVGGGELSLAQARRALWQADGDVEEAALHAYGIEATSANLRALRSVRELSETKKAEDGGGETAQQVLPGTQDNTDAAKAISNAFAGHYVYPVNLGGKHSGGTLLARDDREGEVYLLKPGSGGQSPAAGSAENPASQSCREAAFWQVADVWGLGAYIPKTDLVLVDNRQYACIKMLAWRYRAVDEILQQDPGFARRLFGPYLQSGVLHRWAVLDGVLGNPDRHANNIMADAERPAPPQLIDHGSAFAGQDFDPARDENSFVPFYLRAWASSGFNKLLPEERLKVMPRVNADVAETLGSWLAGLHAADLEQTLQRYGVDPGPSVDRLAKLRVLQSQDPTDLAINRFWVET